MELGNLIFGHGMGGYAVPRTATYEAPLHVVLERIPGWGFGSGPAFENDVFAVRPYYWGDCTCGYDERETAFSRNTHHDAECYQWRVYDDMVAAGYQPSDSGLFRGRPYIPSPRGGDLKKFDATMQEARKRWCEHFGLPFPGGCAVHCTCNYKTKWAEFLAENDHASECPMVLPNFHHKPSGLTLEWYKYPLRDAYFNRPVKPEEWRRICRECEDSLGDES